MGDPIDTAVGASWALKGLHFRVGLERQKISNQFIKNCRIPWIRRRLTHFHFPLIKAMDIGFEGHRW